MEAFVEYYIATWNYQQCPAKFGHVCLSLAVKMNKAGRHGMAWLGLAPCVPACVCICSCSLFRPFCEQGEFMCARNISVFVRSVHSSIGWPSFSRPLLLYLLSVVELTQLLLRRCTLWSVQPFQLSWRVKIFQIWSNLYNIRFLLNIFL